MNRAAVKRQFILIGEALNVMAQRESDLFAAIREGRQIIDFCTLLMHEDQNVNDRVVWGAIQTDLPALAQHCSDLLAQREQGLI